jgi:hypothetical protein
MANKILFFITPFRLSVYQDVHVKLIIKNIPSVLCSSKVYRRYTFSLRTPLSLSTPFLIAPLPVSRNNSTWMNYSLGPIPKYIVV